MKKVFIALFKSEDLPEPALENIFATKELAMKYIRIERIKRDLRADELWMEERKVIYSDIEFLFTKSKKKI